MTNNEIEVLASELPILDDKQNYKYIDEIALILKKWTIFIQSVK